MGRDQVVQQIHVKLKEETHRKLRVKAALQNKSIQSFVEDLVERDLKSFKLPEV